MLRNKFIIGGIVHIIHIAAELAPVAKVGGLADVVLGLSRELSWKGHDVDIILPKYDCMDSNEIRDMAIFDPDVPSFFGGSWHNNAVWVGWVENLKVYFIDPHHGNYYFNRGCFYGCVDDVDRYMYFSRAAMDFIEKQRFNVDLIHIHDWQTAVIAPLQKQVYAPKGLTKPKVIFTIHNIEYQGKCQPYHLDQVGLDSQQALKAGDLVDPQDPSLVNLLKGAIVQSNYVTTVSPTYAREVQTPEGGRGLEDVLRKHEDTFFGVLNGIDYSFWNPEIDRYLPAHYSSREFPKNKADSNTLDKKGYVKKKLRERLLLEEIHRPIIGCIARLVPQKGVEMIEKIIPYILEHEGQFVLLGASPIPEINEHFQQLRHKYSEHPNVHMILHHQEELSHLIYAGSDMFIVPSLFEPCGLTQMIALKYGAIPIVRKTGGLADTIFDVDNPDIPEDQRNGYVFEEPTTKALAAALQRALDCWFHQPERWRQMMVKGMDIDFSWNHPADKYLEIYNKP